MNHIAHELALARRDELLRQTADRRRVSQAGLTREASSSIFQRGKRRRLRLLQLQRAVTHSREGVRA